MPREKSKAEITAESDAKWRNQEWLKFPTVSLDDEGNWHYWDVTEGSRICSDDRSVGEALARGHRGPDAAFSGEQFGVAPEATGAGRPRPCHAPRSLAWTEPGSRESR